MLVFLELKTKKAKNHKVDVVSVASNFAKLLHKVAEVAEWFNALAC